MKPTQLAAASLVISSLTKQAAAYDGYAGLSHQSYLPVQKRRNLSKGEEAEIEEASSNILPRIFPSDADPITADMASPGWSAAMHGTLGAGVGGLLGGALGRDDKTSALTAIIGALLGGGIGGAAGYFGRKSKNETLRDRMTRLPEGATRRDMKADPVYQKELDRAAALQAALSQAGGLGYGMSSLSR